MLGQGICRYQSQPPTNLHKHSYEMHDKVAIIDDHIIITGSFNWTGDANTRNDENLVILDNQAWAAAHEQEFQTI